MPFTASPYEAGKFDILAGRSGSTSRWRLLGAGRKCQPASAEQLVALAARATDFAVIHIDLGAGIEQHVPEGNVRTRQQSNRGADGRAKASLTDAYAFASSSASQSARIRCPSVQVVVNQAASQKEGEGVPTALLSNRIATAELSEISLCHPC